MFSRKKDKKNNNRFPNQVRCKCCGRMIEAIVGKNPYCRKHRGFVHHDCFVPEFNQCIDCWNK